jgi:hypothetical protein
MGSGSVQIDQEPVFETPDEQRIGHSYKFLDLPAFHFLVGVAKREGQLPTSLREVSFASFDAGKFVRPERVALLRKLLMRQSGQDAAAIRAAVAARLQATPAAPDQDTPPKPPPQRRRRWDRASDG